LPGDRDVTGLGERFAALVRRLGGTGESVPVFEALIAAWRGPGRHYHTLAHLRDTLAELDQAAPTAPTDMPVEAALWFHDAVYDPRAHDNEARSAAWAERALAELGVRPATAGEVARLVRLTRHDTPPADDAGKLLCDVDLSILGRDPDTFAHYEAAVRAEYDWLSDAEWRAGRCRVLETLLARQPLFATAHFRTRYEAPARRNLAASLQRLGPGAL